MRMTVVVWNRNGTPCRGGITYNLPTYPIQGRRIWKTLRRPADRKAMATLLDSREALTIQAQETAPNSNRKRRTKGTKRTQERVEREKAAGEILARSIRRHVKMHRSRKSYHSEGTGSRDPRSQVSKTSLQMEFFQPQCRENVVQNSAEVEAKDACGLPWWELARAGKINNKRYLIHGA